jgi:predicted PurR-regulated permease PerM
VTEEADDQPPQRPSLYSAPGFTFRRALSLLGFFLAVYSIFLLRGLLASLAVAFLLAYALDPIVDRLEKSGLPRPAGAILVMMGIVTLLFGMVFFGIPLFLDELRDVGSALPNQMADLGKRLEPWLWTTLKLRMPHSLADLTKAYGDRLQGELPTMVQAGAVALFGTLSYLSVLLSALIVPVFALYLLIDFDHIVRRGQQLIPRRWVRPVSSLGAQIHGTLGSYVRGQITANIILSACYAAGLRLVDIRLAVPIGVLTGMLAFVPYVGFSVGLFCALAMAVLDWHGLGPILGVLGVMGVVQLLDSFLITPRIVGRSVGLAPLEVLLTMSAAASLLGFLGVLLAVPLGAVLKILLARATRAYLRSDFYATPSDTSRGRQGSDLEATGHRYP